jgi:hypothetical protein
MVRYKNRYFVCCLHTDEVNARYLKGVGGGLRGALLKELEKVVSTNFGPALSGPILSSLQVRTISSSSDFDKEGEQQKKGKSKKRKDGGNGSKKEEEEEFLLASGSGGGGGCSLVLVAVVRCSREHSRDVRAAITLLTQVAGCKVAASVIRTKGSPRTMANLEQKLQKILLQ